MTLDFFLPPWYFRKRIVFSLQQVCRCVSAVWCVRVCPSLRCKHHVPHLHMNADLYKEQIHLCMSSHTSPDSEGLRRSSRESFILNTLNTSDSSSALSLHLSFYSYFYISEHVLLFPASFASVNVYRSWESEDKHIQSLPLIQTWMCLDDVQCNGHW